MMIARIAHTYLLHSLNRKVQVAINFSLLTKGQEICCITNDEKSNFFTIIKQSKILFGTIWSFYKLKFTFSAMLLISESAKEIIKNIESNKKEIMPKCANIIKWLNRCGICHKIVISKTVLR